MAKRPTLPTTGSGGRSLRPEPFAQRLSRIMRRLVFVCLALALLSGTGFCAWRLHHFIYHSDYFKVREIRISGDSEELNADARAWLEAKVKECGNLCLLNKRFLASQLARRPRAKAVQISKIYPGTLKVEFLKVRTPVIILQLDEPYLMDDEGVLLSRLRPEKIRETNLPILTGIHTAASHPGDRVQQDRLADVLKAVLYIKDHESYLHRMIVEWNINGRSREITAILNTHTEVRFGDRPPVELLDKLITGLEEDKDLENAHHIDLRWERQIVYK